MYYFVYCSDCELTGRAISRARLSPGEPRREKSSDFADFHWTMFTCGLFKLARCALSVVIFVALLAFVIWSYAHPYVDNFNITTAFNLTDVMTFARRTELGPDN